MNSSFLVSGIFFFLLASIVEAQVGVTLCACQPGIYTFTFDFSLKCADQNIGGDGIQDTACVIDTEIDQVLDQTPVAVSKVQIFELDQNLNVIVSTKKIQEFRNFDSFNYTSIISRDIDTINETSVPRGLQLSITGRNAMDQSLVNSWLILYNNDCGLYPILTEGQTAGWTELTDLIPPPSAVCPLAAQPSPVPSAGSRPSSLPTLVNIEPTFKPITAPPLPPLPPISAPPVPSPSGPTSRPSGLPTPVIIEPTYKPITAPPLPPFPPISAPPFLLVPSTVPTIIQSKNPAMEPSTPPTCKQGSKGKKSSKRNSIIGKGAESDEGYYINGKGKGKGKGKGGTSSPTSTPTHNSTTMPTGCTEPKDRGKGGKKKKGGKGSGIPSQGGEGKGKGGGKGGGKGKGKGGGKGKGKGVEDAITSQTQEETIPAVGPFHFHR